MRPPREDVLTGTQPGLPPEIGAHAIGPCGATGNPHRWSTLLWRSHRSLVRGLTRGQDFGLAASSAAEASLMGGR